MEIQSERDADSNNIPASSSQAKKHSPSPLHTTHCIEKDSMATEEEGSQRTSRSPSTLSGSDELAESSKIRAVSTGKKSKNSNKKSAPVNPIMILGLPLAEEEACKSFTEIPVSTYANKKMGMTKIFDDEDSGRCDCRPFKESESRSRPSESEACGPKSNCINRTLLVECGQDCKSGKFCQNQRFQNREFSMIEIVKTAKKGFGIRSGTPIKADSFIYEYIGEVIGEKAFSRRIKEYANQDIRHFYFMMLDRDVFIDATKKGGKGRFLNHSCNPNCYVSKWTINGRMRMGIFSKRDILYGEELTFDYNVDRYGHDAQECFCGEPNCVGFLGGKTQTDLGGMDDLYLDALGISDQVHALQLKGTKKKKGKKLDEDFIPVLSPIEDEDVSTVAAALRQALSTRLILIKILERITITQDSVVQSQLLRLKGFNIISAILTEYKEDDEVIIMCLRVLQLWPLLARNKVVTSRVDEYITNILEERNEKEEPINSTANNDELPDGNPFKEVKMIDLPGSSVIKDPKIKIEGNDAGTTEVKMEIDEDSAVKSEAPEVKIEINEETDTKPDQMDRDHTTEGATQPVVDKSEEVLKTEPEDIDAKRRKDIGRIGRKLLSTWSKLELGYRIPRAVKDSNDEGGRKRDSESPAGFSNPPKRVRILESTGEITLQNLEEVNEEESKFRAQLQTSTPLPSGWRRCFDKANFQQYWLHVNGGRTYERPTEKTNTRPSPEEREKRPPQPVQPPTVDELIAQVEARERLKQEEIARQQLEKDQKEEELKQKERKRESRRDGEQIDSHEKEKRIKKLFGDIVVKILSNYKSEFEHDQFKRRAKELTEVLCAKERRQPHFATEKYGSLTSEKTLKVKAFVKDWVKKLLERKLQPQNIKAVLLQKESSLSNESATSEHSSPQTPLGEGLKPVSDGKSKSKRIS